MGFLLGIQICFDPEQLNKLLEAIKEGSGNNQVLAAIQALGEKLDAKTQEIKDAITTVAQTEVAKALEQRAEALENLAKPTSQQ